MRFLILQHPGHNRVYYNSADKLALAELAIAARRLSVNCTAIDVVEIEGIRYLALDTDQPLSEKDLQILSRLSFVFALYEIENIDEIIRLIPVRKLDYEYLNSKISSLLKYQGKTNELFTKMMINVALLASEFDYDDKITLLDPVAGKGTSLFEGAVYGFDVFGIEIESKSVQESTIFFKKYLETERLKHTSTNRQIFGTNKSDVAHIHEFDYAFSKDDFKSPNSVKKLGVVTGNAQNAFKYFKKEIFHLLVGDLPYGIFHGSKSAKAKASNTRNPTELVNACLPEWHKVLKKGGTIVIAWNSFLVSRQKLSELFSEHGFEVLSYSPFNEFEHMVDKAIKRDIVVAKKI